MCPNLGGCMFDDSITQGNLISPLNIKKSNALAQQHYNQLRRCCMHLSKSNIAFEASKFRPLLSIHWPPRLSQTVFKTGENFFGAAFAAFAILAHTQSTCKALQHPTHGMPYASSLKLGRFLHGHFICRARCADSSCSSTCRAFA